MRLGWVGKSVAALAAVLVGTIVLLATPAGANDAWVQDGRLDFGSSPVGVAAEPLALDITLTHWMPDEIRILRVVTSGPDGAAFSIISEDCSTAVLRDNGPAWGDDGECTVRVGFAPGKQGSNTGELRLLKGTEVKATVALVGTGAPGPDVAESSLAATLPAVGLGAAAVAFAVQRRRRRTSGS